jgi:glycosyltransferase involved in cell wall biosynthesis
MAVQCDLYSETIDGCLPFYESGEPPSARQNRIDGFGLHGFLHPHMNLSLDPITPSLAPFSVHLFTNYVGDQQTSMFRYANNLQTGLKEYANSACTVSAYSPRSNGGKASNLVSRWKRFVEYPVLAYTHAGQINHILDHGNSHLINYLPRARTVITCHDLNTIKLAHLPGAPSKRYVYSFRAKVAQMKKAACVIADSETNRLDIIEHVGVDPEKIRVVYLGVDHERFRPLEKNEDRDGLRDKFKFTWPFTIFHIGVPAFYKNLEGIIETLAVVRRQHKVDAHFVRVGAPLSPTQQALIEKHGLSNYVHTLSPKNDAELRELYLASDVLLFPSWGEGFGLPPLEAFCCGTPVVVSNLPAIVEGTASAALQASPDDPSAMASAVVRIYEDPALRLRMREEGFIRARLFTWKNTALGTAKVYQDLWEKNGRCA